MQKPYSTPSIPLLLANVWLTLEWNLGSVVGRIMPLLSRDAYILVLGICYITWQSYIKVADKIKIVNQLILR